MSLTLENMMDSFLLKKVPDNWASIAYPSLKPLFSWINDFVERLEFYKKWVDQLN